MLYLTGSLFVATVALAAWLARHVRREVVDGRRLARRLRALRDL